MHIWQRHEAALAGLTPLGRSAFRLRVQALP